MKSKARQAGPGKRATRKSEIRTDLRAQCALANGCAPARGASPVQSCAQSRIAAYLHNRAPLATQVLCYVAWLARRGAASAHMSHLTAHRAYIRSCRLGPAQKAPTVRWEDCSRLVFHRVMLASAARVTSPLLSQLLALPFADQGTDLRQGSRFGRACRCDAGRKSDGRPRARLRACADLLSCALIEWTRYRHRIEVMR